MRTFKHQIRRPQHRTLFSHIPRALFSVSRLPIALGITGAGGLAYFDYKMNQIHESIKIPDWVKSTFEKGVESGNDIISQLNQMWDQIDVPVVVREQESNEQPTEEPSRSNKHPIKIESPDPDLMKLTKKLIAVRNLLKNVDLQGDTLNLPSIVVVGSQSSGKSSVLESIVGQEFLPKGQNMVTRRPIELTLVHSPNLSIPYALFPQIGLGKVTDFHAVRKTLVDLNLAVSDDVCVSSEPIELHVYSSTVPDLTLIDLPGYIQVTTATQPIALKQKIVNLCAQYIKSPNVILAVSAADVDLANSEALQQARLVDPKGTRTIGVVTKMDLVDSKTGNSILLNKSYPLKLGYVGVSSRGSLNSTLYPKARVGTNELTKLLMTVLEDRMASSLDSIRKRVREELADARYHLKVHYNDKRVSAASYIADAVDAVKTKMREFERKFDKPTVRSLISELLKARVGAVCSDIYYDSPDCFVGCDAVSGERLLDSAAAALTKSGLGRATTQLVVDALMHEMNEIATSEPWIHHDSARKKITDTAADFVSSVEETTVDQVENTIKPFKFADVECSTEEWTRAQKSAADYIERELASLRTNVNEIKANLGRRKLRQAIAFINAGEKVPEGAERPFSSSILNQARSVLELSARERILNSRLKAVKSRGCRSDSNRTCCPEVYLHALTDKLAHTAGVFIRVEMLNEFFEAVPRRLEGKLYYDVRGDAVKEFACENAGVAEFVFLFTHRHLKCLERAEVLAQVSRKIAEIGGSD